MATVALAVCIARTLARENPALLRSFAEQAERMRQHLYGQDRPEWAQLLIPFALAVERPDQYPSLNPPAG
jgi:hypothetical protein